MYGKIKAINEISNFQIEPTSGMNGTGGARLGMAQMINALAGYQGMDGYAVEAENDTFHVLIDNGQSCCESWGYFSSDDDLQQYIGADLREVNLTDTALNKKNVEDREPYGFDEGGIQFVDFVTDKGTFQLAVYNSHNGYYGHPIVVAKGNEIMLSNVL